MHYFIEMKNVVLKNFRIALVGQDQCPTLVFIAVCFVGMLKKRSNSNRKMKSKKEKQRKKFIYAPIHFKRVGKKKRK